MSLLKKIALATIALVYGTSLFSLAIPFATHEGLFVSPDEHATWTFAEKIAETGIAQVEEVRNISLNGFLHPRSTVTVENFIVPAGFLGLTYIAGLLFFISPLLAASVGPIFCILGLIALYKIVRFLGASQEFAVYTTTALAIHPAWWYYSIRSLMPNVPFVALLLIAGWTAATALQQKQIAYRCISWIFAGSLFGSALAIRPSEWIWILGCLFAGACYLVQARKDALREAFTKRKKEIACFFIGVGFAGGLILVLQLNVYGSPFTTGYTVDQPVWEVGNAIAAHISVPWHEKLFAILFPFGIHERATLTNVWRYVVVLYPLMTAVGMLGVGGWVWGVVKRMGWMRADGTDTNSLLVIPTKGEISHSVKMFIFPYLFIFLSVAYLLVLYGSWVFYDNPDPSVISLGNSHTRYWLPIFVVLAPAIAYALLRAKEILISWSLNDRTKKLAYAFPVAILVLMSVCSAHLVFLGDDGVLHTRAALATFAEKRTEILGATPEDAIIIVDRADKYLWPDRAVIVPFRSEETYAKIPELLDAAPLYYFSITLPEEDLMHLHETIFAGTNIIFTPIMTIQEETLYEISRK